MNFLAIVQDDATRTPALDENLRHRRGTSNGAAARLERSTERVADGAHAAARETPGAHRIVYVAHVVMQEYVSGSRRARAQCRADDGAAGEMRFDDFALEIFVEEIRRAHGPKAQGVVHPFLAQAVEALAEIQQFLDVARLERGRIGRLAHQERLDELALAHHIARIAVVGLRIALRMAGDFPAQCIVIVIDGEMAAAMHHGAAALVRNHLQTVFRQFQRAHDFRPQQAAHIGAIRVGKVLVELATDGGTADVRVTLEHEDFETRARQVARCDETVVAGPDDDGIEVLVHGRRCGHQAGTFCVAPFDFKVASTAISNAESVSRRHDSSWAAEMNHGSRESGSHSTPSSCSTWAMAS